MTPELAQGFGLTKPAGALVAGLTLDGPAARAGFAQGDVILAINGRPIDRMRDLSLVVAELPIGRAADVSVWRRERTVSLRPIVEEMPQDRANNEPANSDDMGPHKSAIDVFAGLKLAPLTANSAEGCGSRRTSAALS